MKNILSTVLLIGILLFALPAGSQTANKSYPLGTLLNAAVLNTSDTFTIGPTLGSKDQLLNYSKLILEVFYDYTAAAGTINITCLAGQTVATATYQLTVCSSVSSAGVCTLAIGAGSMTTASLSADTYYQVRMGIAGSKALSCTVTHSVGGAGEKATVTGYLVKD